jgi:hypothetical protein
MIIASGPLNVGISIPNEEDRRQELIHFVHPGIVKSAPRPPKEKKGGVSKVSLSFMVQWTNLNGPVYLCILNTGLLTLVTHAHSDIDLYEDVRVYSPIEGLLPVSWFPLSSLSPLNSIPPPQSPAAPTVVYLKLVIALHNSGHL